MKTPTTSPPHTPRRVFLGWQRPAIDLVAERLLLVERENPELFRRMLVIVPTRESGRRLREVIAEKAPGQAILMPRILLPTQILPLDPAVLPTDIEQYAAWIQELDPAHVTELYPDLFPKPPRTELGQDWVLSVTDQLQSIRFRLDQYGITPQSAIALLQEGRLPVPESPTDAEREASKPFLMQEESSRWENLQRLAQRVDTRLRQHGKSSYREALQHALSSLHWPGASRLMVLACLPQLTPCLQQAIAKLHGLDGGIVESWIHAPQEMAHLFTPCGTPTEAWSQCCIPIREEQIHVVAHEGELADTALQLIASSPDEEVALGTCDPRFFPALEDAFGKQGWLLYNPQGRSIATTDLAALPQLLSQAAHPHAGARALDTLLRNQVMLHLFGIADTERCCRQLDIVSQVHFPDSASAMQDCFERLQQDDPTYSPTLHYLLSTRDFIQRLASQQTLPGALEELADRLDSTYTAPTPYADCARTLATLVRSMASFLRASGSSPAFGFETALSLISHLFRNTSLQEKARHDCALDTLGWLELPYATGSHLILTGLHEGCVPESPGISPLLPDSIRRSLGLDHAGTLLARDSYLLSALLASHPRTDIILSRHTPERDPIIPSKLLLRCASEPADLLTRRVHTLFMSLDAPAHTPAYERGNWFTRKPGRPAPPSQPTGPASTHPPTQVPPDIQKTTAPPPAESISLIAEPQDNLWADTARPFSPTIIGQFLTCPLRFWLRHALQLDPQDLYDEYKSSADARESGTLLHRVIDEVTGLFPRWEQGLTAEKIATEACRLLHSTLQETYGQDPPLSVRALQSIMEEKLRSFADFHMDDLAEGWQILHRELPVHHLELAPGMSVSMRIDRIDVHQQTGRYRVIDYKSSIKSPAERHLETLPDVTAYQWYMQDLPLYGNQRWRDVQLPLYAEYVRRRWNPTTPVELAYYCIPLSRKPVCYAPWLIDTAGISSALQAARVAMELIRSGRCLVPAEAFGGTAHGSFGGLAPEQDLRCMLGLPPLPPPPST